MSCGCGASGDSTHSCSTKSSSGCAKTDTCGNSYKLSVFNWLSDIKNSPASSCDFVEVRFKNERKSFYKNVNGLPLQMGSIVTVESSPGHDVGIVTLTGELVRIQMKKKGFSEDNFQKIYRIANQKDVEVWKESREREEGVKREARKIALHQNLAMKISDVEFQGDGSKATFYYTAESRVDFRQLIRDFAVVFRTKIDMKQIGFRQEAAKLGGIGSCGRELCCSSWLTDFRSVNTNAARYQQLSINPQKLAGQCGKLKCCLNYELDSYMDALRDFPPSSTNLDTENGRAFCIKIDVFKKKMWFAYAEKAMTWYDISTKDVKRMIEMNKKGEKCTPLEDLTLSSENNAPKPDLIEENNLNRFDRKPKNNRNRDSRPRNSQNNDSKTGNSENRNREGRNFENKNFEKRNFDKKNQPENPNSGEKRPNPNFKNKRKPFQKKDNNA